MEMDPVEEDDDDIVKLVKTISSNGVTEKIQKYFSKSYKSFLLSALRGPV